MDKHELLDTYNNVKKTVLDCIGNDSENELSSWLKACAIRIWAGNKHHAEGYIDALEVITGTKYTVAQVHTALACASDRTIVVPEFFKMFVVSDINTQKADSRKIIELITKFLMLMAFVNYDFTFEEARVLTDISDKLSRYCDEKGVSKTGNSENFFSQITPLKEDSYYKTEEKEAITEQSTSSVNNPVSEKPEPVIPTIENKPINNIINEPISNSNNNGVSVTKAGENPDDTESLESLLDELDGLVGLDKVKYDVRSLMNFIKVCKMRKERNLKIPTVSYHLVFTGNPGTGKTTIARMVAKLYYFLGILPQGQLVETDRSGLVAGYLGQTAIKTQKVIQEALGGVLFIDEAYSLVNDEDDSYGKEAIETILKAMEDHRDELVVIVAGYDELMHKFIDSNPGLRSRFNKYFQFPDYTGEQLLQIMMRFCETNGYVLSADAVPFLQEKCNQMFQSREEHFGNARAIRNIFESAINHQANRLVMDNDITVPELMEITKDDIMKSMENI